MDSTIDVESPLSAASSNAGYPADDQV
uniref:Uncharacterized protein n=1 Tax=Rhizophora mucronata TaxID=61149 RepID=A0A2P2QHI3_RHIMU